jgi:hypothetical protein
VQAIFYNSPLLEDENFSLVMFCLELAFVVTIISGGLILLVLSFGFELRLLLELYLWEVEKVVVLNDVFLFLENDLGDLLDLVSCHFAEVVLYLQLIRTIILLKGYSYPVLIIPIGISHLESFFCTYLLVHHSI